MANGIGSLAWMTRSGGRLSGRERWRLIAQAVLAQVGAKLGGRAGRRARHMDLDALAPPDSEICRAAEALERSVCPPWLQNHNRRAWIWGQVIEGAPKADREAYYVSALLHDFGLTERYRGEGPDRACFTLAGAREAERLGEQAGWPEARTRIAAQAITLHLNLSIDHRYGPEARMLRAGTAADVVGQAMESVAKQTRQQVVARHPRLDFKTRILEAFEEDRNVSPCCRGTFLFHRLGGARMVRATPFFEQ